MKQAGKILLSSVLILGVGIFLSRQFERLPIVQHDYPSNRPQAAAMQLLDSWQKQTRYITSATELFPLPDSSVLLIIERHQGHLPLWQQQALIEWVESGGKLLINAVPLQEDARDSLSADDIRKHDPLVYYFGVTSWLDRDAPNRQELPLPSATGVAVLEYNFRRFCLDRTSYQDECVTTTCGTEHTELQYAWLEAFGQRLQLDPQPGVDLLHHDLFENPHDDDPVIPLRNTTVTSRANNGTHDLLLQLAAGAGEVWVFTSLDIFSNDRLHHLDHAFLLSSSAPIVSKSGGLRALPCHH
ncbi:MAG: DUF4350 domain-containing protein [Alcanivoracaceae bacterium]|jgi:hypothetical protein|nr:DUF4350 domain-containing protein [Alcanivoracaceae bacterium]